MTTNVELEIAAKRLNLLHFRGVVFKDEVRRLGKPLGIECGILGSKKHSQDDMHWTSWFKCRNNKYTFDSFGLPPDENLEKYLRSPILFSTFQIQQFNQSTCGQWCIWFLHRMNEILRQNEKVDDKDYVDVILDAIDGKTY